MTKWPVDLQVDFAESYLVDSQKPNGSGLFCDSSRLDPSYDVQGTNSGEHWISRSTRAGRPSRPVPAIEFHQRTVADGPVFLRRLIPPSEMAE